VFVCSINPVKDVAVVEALDSIGTAPGSSAGKAADS